MHPEVIHVLLIEDHPAMGYGTKMLLEQNPNIQVIGIAETGAKGLSMVEQYKPAIVFLDFYLPDTTGKELARVLKEKYPTIHIVVFTGYDYVPFFNELVQAGVSGIMTKSATPKQLARMIESILNGETVVPLSIFRQIHLNEYQEQKNHRDMGLTEKEKKILSMVAQGYTNAQIAKDICVSTRSVEYYLTKIYGKLNVNSRAEAVEIYVREMKSK